MWRTNDVLALSNASLLELLANEVPAVRLADFASSNETRAFGEAMKERSRRTSSIAQVTRLGISQYAQGLMGSKQQYFGAAGEARLEYEEIFAASFNPMQRLLEALTAHGFEAGTMEEPGFGPYFAGTGKVRNGVSPIHVDFSPQDSEGWAVAGLLNQLAWNFYIRVPERGGELLLWDRRWEREHDQFVVPGQYYFSEQVVAGARHMKLTVQPGEVLLINSRNYHAVAESTDRLAYGSFLAHLGGRTLRAFS